MIAPVAAPIAAPSDHTACAAADRAADNAAQRTADNRAADRILSRRLLHRHQRRERQKGPAPKVRVMSLFSVPCRSSGPWLFSRRNAPFGSGQIGAIIIEYLPTKSSPVHRLSGPL
jgi:hypothetical protein